jgi:hypothetical protein
MLAASFFQEHTTHGKTLVLFSAYQPLLNSKGGALISSAAAAAAKK